MQTLQQFASLEPTRQRPLQSIAYENERNILSIYSSDKKAQTSMSRGLMSSADQLSLFANQKITVVNNILQMTDDSPRLVISD